jgi:hypothetical protein
MYPKENNGPNIGAEPNQRFAVLIAGKGDNRDLRANFAQRD